MRWLCVVCVGFVLGCDDGPQVLSTSGGDAMMSDAMSVDGSLDEGVVDAGPADMEAPDQAMDQAVQPDMRPIDMALPPVDMAPDLAPPPVDMAPPPADMAPPPVDMAPPPDMGPAAVPLCGGCMADGDCEDDSACAALVDGQRCVPVCNAQMPGACPPGFSCVGDRCLPAGARCDSCTLAGCPADQRCDPFSGNCVEKTGRCGLCEGDDDCQPDLSCRQVGATQHCLPDCGPIGQCPDGLICVAGACSPIGGVCDACGGCPLLRPLCNGFTGECLQCGLGTPCLPGFNCTLEGECVPAPAPGACNSDLDCGAIPGQPRCREGMCAECLDEADCGAGTQCVDGACAPGDACLGVACQVDTECADGRCVDADGQPGCVADADCGDERACNVMTGQCYRLDQRCDDGAVCAPGGVCQPDPFDMNQTVCTCAKQDPANVMEPNDQHRIPCQPGGVCLQFGVAPGVCVQAP